MAGLKVSFGLVSGVAAAVAATAFFRCGLACFAGAFFAGEGRAFLAETLFAVGFFMWTFDVVSTRRRKYGNLATVWVEVSVTSTLRSVCRFARWRTRSRCTPS